MTAAQKAVDWGYTNVYSMDGGFREWKASGLPVAIGFQGQPVVKCIYDQPTGTCQYIVYDRTLIFSVIQSIVE
jgi:3-mercaptopyruvate sulfurtransferase SseA